MFLLQRQSSPPVSWVFSVPGGLREHFSLLELVELSQVRERVQVQVQQEWGDEESDGEGG